jgi:8-oxo-dGTP pyrophosphatase MutT (NUDIX family)
MGDSDEGRWEVVDSRPIYSSEWINVAMADVVLPSGERITHHMVLMPAAAMTVVFNDDDDAILMSWRHRFVPDVWNWELPGGIVDQGEEPAETAAREIVEETGYQPRNLAHLTSFEPMIGMVTSPHHVYVAHGAERVADPTEQDEGRFEWVPLDKVRALIAAGEVRNAGALVGLLYCLAIRGGKELPEPPSLPG